jgi:phage shock protein A
MKKFIYWLMGERAGRVTVSIWNWLWGITASDASEGKAVAIAEESVQTMQASVQKLAEAVSNQVSSYNRARQRYEDKRLEKAQLEHQAAIAQRQGDQESARLAMAKVIRIEQLLSQLEVQLQEAEQFVMASRERLHREQLKLEQYKTDIQNMKDLAEVNQALHEIAKVNSEYEIGSAQSAVEAAKEVVQTRALQQKALADLIADPSGGELSDLENMALEDEISQRLQRLSDATPQRRPSQ